MSQRTIEEGPAAALLLEEAARTMEDRYAVYGDNAERVARVMSILNPEGLTLLESGEFKRHHLFMLLIMKICRFGGSGLTHRDSILDAVNYAAMLAALLPPPGGDQPQKEAK